MKRSRPRPRLMGRWNRGIARRLHFLLAINTVSACKKRRCGTPIGVFATGKERCQGRVREAPSAKGQTETGLVVGTKRTAALCSGAEASEWAPAMQGSRSRPEEGNGVRTGKKPRAGQEPESNPDVTGASAPRRAGARLPSFLRFLPALPSVRQCLRPPASSSRRGGLPAAALRAGAGIALLLGAAFGPATVHGQAVEFLGNDTQGTDVELKIGSEWDSIFNRRDGPVRRNQAFRTGSNPDGYLLTKLVLYMNDFTSSDHVAGGRPELRVRLRSVHNRTTTRDPHSNTSELFAFAIPTPSSAQEAQDFVPSSAATEAQKTLPPNTWYAIDVHQAQVNPSRENNVKHIDLVGTASDTYSSLEGWQVDGEHLRKDRPTNRFWSRDQNSFRMKIFATRISDATTVTLTASPGSIGENGGQSTIRGSVAPAPEAAFTVDVAATPTAGTAATVSDYTLSSNTTLSFAAGATASTGTVTLAAVNDDTYTGDRGVTLSGTSTAEVDILSSMVAIVEDEAAPAPNRAAADPTHNSAVLSWVFADRHGSSVVEYRLSANGGSFGNWTEIPASRPTQSNGRQYEVPNLASSTEYAFKLRYKRGNSTGPEVEAGATTFEPFTARFTDLPAFRDSLLSSTTSQYFTVKGAFSSELRSNRVLAPRNDLFEVDGAVFIGRDDGRSLDSFFMELRARANTTSVEITLKAPDGAKVKCTAAEADTAPIRKICSADLRPLSEDVTGIVRARREVRLALDTASISEDGGVANLTARLHKPRSWGEASTANETSDVDVYVDVEITDEAGDIEASGTRLTIRAGSRDSNAIALSALDNVEATGNRRIAIAAETPSEGHVTVDSETSNVELEIEEDDVGLLAPDDFEATPGPKAVRLSWDPTVNPFPHAYDYRYWSTGSPPDWQQIADSNLDGANHSSFLISGLAKETAYTFEIRATVGQYQSAARSADVTTLSEYTVELEDSPAHFRSGEEFVVTAVFSAELLRFEGLHHEHTSQVVVQGGTYERLVREGLGRGGRAWNLTIRPDSGATEVTVSVNAEEPPQLRCALDETERICSVALHPLTQGASVTVPVYAAPAFDAGLPTRVEVAENTAADTDIGSPFTATDNDNDMLTWTLDGTDKASFAVDSGTGQLKTKAALDHEATSSYSVTVTVSDGTGSDTHEVSVGVTDVDEPPGKPAAPTLHSRARTSLTVEWKAPSNEGKPDIESYDLQYRAAGSEGEFTAGPQGVSGTRAEITPLAPATGYEVRVRASSDEGKGDWSDALTAATDPVVSIEAASATVTEGPNAAAAFTLSRTGAAAGALTVAVSVTQQGDYIDGAAPTSVTFDADAAAAELAVEIQDDLRDEADGSVTVTLVGGAGYTVDPGANTATVTVNDEDTPNDPPVFDTGLPGSVGVAENTAADTDIGSPFTATDPDAGTTLAYSLAGTDKDHFAIDSSSAQLKTKGALDFEGKTGYSVSIEVTDGRERVARALTVNVTDVDEPPGKPAAPVLDARDRTSLTVSWVDPDNLGKPPIESYDLQYRASGAAYRAGPQDQSLNRARIRNLSPATVYDIQVRATNAEGDGGWSDALTVPTDPAVSIAPRSGGEAVTEGTDSAAVFVVSRTGATTGALTVNLLSVTQQGEYIDGTPPTSVTIAANAASAELGVAIDDDDKDEADGSITVTLTDGAGYAVEPGGTAATVTVNDNPNAGPVITTTSPIEHRENLTEVATLTAADADSDPIQWSITGGADAAAFNLTGDGELTFVTSPNFEEPADANANNDYVVDVRASDGTDRADLTLTVNVTNVREVLRAPDSFTLDERTRMTLKFSWNPPRGSSGLPEVTEYRLRYRVDDSSSSPQTKILAASTMSATIMELTPATTYEVTIRARNSDALGVRSNPLIVGTDPAVSIAPRSGGETVTEGTDDKAVFVVSRTGETAEALTVTVSVTQQGDYIDGTPPASVAFETGEATAELRVAIDDDDVDEADGSITATVQAGTAYSLDGSTTEATVTVNDEDELALNVNAIAGDDTINIAERSAGFAISGDTGSEGGVTVTVGIGGATLTATSADDAGTAAWSVSVPADAAYITGTSVAVSVSAAKTGVASPSDVTRTLTVDLVAPQAPTYTAPESLQVGVPIAAMNPSGGAGIAAYAAPGLPSGLSIHATTGAIDGTPGTANASTALARVTATDTAGNPATVDIAFPAVDKGDQTLAGFQYSTASVEYGAAAPTVTEPTGERTTLSYSATPATVCTVVAATGALVLVGAGQCVVTVTAAGTADYNEATDTFTVAVQPTGTLVLNVNAIATDDTINIAEKASGFAISGDTGSEGGVDVTVTVGGTDLTAASADANPATWSVSVPGNASYIAGTSVAVAVNASKTGYSSPSAEQRTLTVDLVAPTPPAYTAPGSLTVGVPIAAMNPSGGAGIDEYAAPGLPSGLGIDTATGAIGGTPDTADADTAEVTVTVSDSAGNADTVDIAFPAVDKGDQTLAGFQYSSASVEYGAAAPTVTEPTGERTTLSYSATPAMVCTVVAATGALTLVGAGDCVVTVTAAGTDDYNEASDTFTVTVQAIDQLALNVNAIAGDNTINIAEKASGFAISGDTGSEGGVDVTVTVGGTDLTTASADANPATWSVSVPGNASYIAGTSVAVAVNASKTGYSPPSAEQRTLTVDLVAPTPPAYTAPGSLTVGVPIAAMNPSGGAGIDEYAAPGLPSGLGIDTATGAIGGTPDTADADTAEVTVTVSDSAGNADTVDIAFPAVGKGDQTLAGFQYSSASVEYGAAAPTVTEPTGERTTLSYSATPAMVCTVVAATGALTLVGAGDCVVTVTAAGTDDYNEASDTFTVTVQAIDQLALNVNAIAGDNTINIAEKASGFAISGDTGSEGGVDGDGDGGRHGSDDRVTPTANPATWSVSVPGNASYIAGTSVAVAVNASKTGYTPPGAERRTLTVDLVAPTPPGLHGPEFADGDVNACRSRR